MRRPFTTYGCITPANVANPVFDCIANVISLIIFPAPSPTIDAPKIVSFLASTLKRTKPTVLSSQIDRSLSLKCFSMTRYGIPCSSKSLPYKPTEAISGDVNAESF